MELSAKLTSLNKSCNFPGSLCLKVQKPWSLRPIGPTSWEPSPKTLIPGPESCHFPRSLRPIGPKSWEPVLATPGPGLENAQIASLGAHFGHSWCHGQKMLKLRIWGLISSDFGARARKCSNCAFGGSFWPFLGPGPANTQIAPLEAHFRASLGQG